MWLETVWKDPSTDTYKKVPFSYSDISLNKNICNSQDKNWQQYEPKYLVKKHAFLHIAKPNGYFGSFQFENQLEEQGWIKFQMP